MNKPNQDTLVAVAMSGGVDSSVAAVKLKLEGYNVIGLTMKLWDFSEIGGEEDKTVSRRCCSLEMFDDARSVCYKYDIPHYVLNMHEDFHETVIDDFVREYLIGRTPNPCVICNYKVKWELLESKTKQMGCDYLATGHYARIHRDEATGRYQILKGVDSTRDQSYFLWGLKQESLARTMFPLGNMQKSEVRKLAQEYGLINADREESREICFVPNNDYTKLVEKKEPNLPGKGLIRDTEGNVVGEHEGFYKYTVGQRRRIEIKTNQKKYVTQIIPEKNEIVIGDDEDLFDQTFTVKEVNWVTFNPDSAQPATTAAQGHDPRSTRKYAAHNGISKSSTPKHGGTSRNRDVTNATGHRRSSAGGNPGSITALAKIRYLHRPVPATISLLADGNVKVRLHQAQRAITPGQSCVFYDGDVVLGGGKIA